MSETRCGFAALIGRPNVGKSTLMNHLVGQKISITSDRPQTTRNRIRTVLTDERGQIIFVDTPGMLRKAGNKLGEYMMEASAGSVDDADVVLWLVEPSAYIGEGDREICERLKGLKKPVLLVISKVDTIPKEQVLTIIAAWKSCYDFAEIIPVSGLRGTNLDDLTDCIFKYLPAGPMLYDPDTLTDQPVREIAAEIIREKALICLREEVPHGIAVTVERYHEREDGLTEIEASLICEKDSHKGIIIGRGGSMLKRIGTLSRRELEELTGGRAYLKLFVKVRKDWRDNELMLKHFGYSRKDL
ncbi:GTPase Era [Chordicoccus furentiruminis]|uniref:GTPase Era n=1 Tax=Chordicoccus furentiruminis TaxID=2709410 RepID=UPI0023A867A7|nr:GTPase Era [Chordicoccus furentiruminis]